MSAKEFNQGLVSMIQSLKQLDERAKALAWALSFDPVEPSPYWTDG